MAPPMASDALDRPRIVLADLVDELAWPDPAPEIGLVETMFDFIDVDEGRKPRY